MERAVNLAVILTQLFVFLGIFYFGGFLVRDLSFRVIEVELLAYGFLPNFFSVFADDHDSSLNPTVVSVVCGFSAYLTLLVG
jgi:Kef-type K+ transport system membrane component KefB